MTTTIGIDIGGTFVDVVVLQDGRIGRYKFPSTPSAPARAVLSGLREITRPDRGALNASDVVRIVHGSTVATNALLERKWARTALVTTEGFRDVLEIGRQNRSSLYDLDLVRPEPIVPRELRYEIAERVASDGTILTPLVESALEALVATLGEDSVDAVAVCLLFSYLEPSHEQRIGSVLRSSLPGVPVTLSSELLPEFREYERTSTTAINAALTPRVYDYLRDLRDRSRTLGIGCPWQVMQSSGTVTGIDRASEQPVRLLLSGPAGGVEGAIQIGRITGVDNLIALDMGGTSCDVSLVRNGEAAYTTEGAIGGYRVAVPMVDIHTIGAGGGSIAWMDDGGSLRVGPQSAGADPGPACYGCGGIEPTVTDAHLVLGHLHPDYPLGGLPRLDVAAAESAVSALARTVKLSTERTALGILEVADAAMEGAIRVISVERGHDPREFTLAAFGGAGPLHAAGLAVRLGIRRIIVPSMAGVLSAYGLLVGRTGYDFSQGIVAPLRECGDRLSSETSRLLDKARSRFREDEPLCDTIAFEVLCDLRYLGQAHELSVPLLRGTEDEIRNGSATLPETAELRFHEAHHDRYGHADPERSVEVVSLRVRAVACSGTGAGMATAHVSSEQIGSFPCVLGVELPNAGRRNAWFRGDQGPMATETPFLERSAIPRERRVVGPAVVLSDDATTIVPPNWEAIEDEAGNLLLSKTWTQGGDKAR